jgi:arsenate reductase (thioredoxin)
MAEQILDSVRSKYGVIDHRAHWGVPDLAAATGTPQEIDRAFSQAFSILDRRIALMLSLPLASLDAMALKSELDNIGKK